MDVNIVGIRKIINTLQRPFDSHEFIRKFAKMYEREYVEFLYEYLNSTPFMTVHLQIAKFLSGHQTELNIRRNGKVSTPNVFGENTDNEQWI
jgi:hypothetical protein